MSTSSITHKLRILQSTYDTPDVFKKLALPRKYTLLFDDVSVSLHIGSHYINSNDRDVKIVTGSWVRNGTGYKIHMSGDVAYAAEIRNIISTVENKLPEYHNNLPIIYNGHSLHRILLNQSSNITSSKSVIKYEKSETPEQQKTSTTSSNVTSSTTAPRTARVPRVCKSCTRNK